MKQIIFIQHALDRLEEREISVDLVKEVLLSPDDIDRIDRRKVAQKLVDDKLVRVIYDEEEDKIIIISA